MARPQDPPLTAGEKAKVAWYVGRMAKRGLAVRGGEQDVDQSDLLRKIETVMDGARLRERETQDKSKRTP